MRAVLAVSAVVLMCAGYVPCLRDAVAGRTRPHAFTWGIWGLTTTIAFALQITHGSGPGAVPTVAAAVACFVVAGLGAQRTGRADITRGDVWFLGGAVAALILWPFLNAPVLSVLVIAGMDLLAIGPTVRKSWSRPEGETLSCYVIGAVRLGLALLAVNHVSFVTVFYPAAWLVINASFAGLLVVRRRVLAKATSPAGIAAEGLARVAVESGP